MLPQMCEADWEIVLLVVPGCLPSVATRRVNGRFLEALHFSTVQNVSWRALPAE